MPYKCENCLQHRAKLLFQHRSKRWLAMAYNYWHELARTPQKVRRRAFMTKSLAQMEESAQHQSVHELKKVLGPALLMVICLGAILGHAPLPSPRFSLPCVCLAVQTSALPAKVAERRCDGETGQAYLCSLVSRTCVGLFIASNSDWSFMRSAFAHAQASLLTT